jgi:hypothetical protein
MKCPEQWNFVRSACFARVSLVGLSNTIIIYLIVPILFSIGNANNPYNNANGGAAAIMLLTFACFSVTGIIGGLVT